MMQRVISIVSLVYGVCQLRPCIAHGALCTCLCVHVKQLLDKSSACLSNCSLFGHFLLFVTCTVCSAVSEYGVSRSVNNVAHTDVTLVICGHLQQIGSHHCLTA